MSETEVIPIGGYFELELPESGPIPHEGAALFQSARAAFLALVRAGSPKRVWMPKYICDAMIDPLVSEKIECVWYDVNYSLEIDEKVVIGNSDWLLYVNYFGLCDAQVSNLLSRVSPDQVVLDYSQAFFSPPPNQALATIYSPRKFFGLPDGGMLVSKIPVDMSRIDQDMSSIDRISHLMLRLASEPEAGYLYYQESEAALSECEPRRMSQLTQRIFASIDFDSARRKRRDNYSYLHDELCTLNQLHLNNPAAAAPMCYPFLTTDAGIRQKLIRKGIFIATYWPDSISRVGEKWAEGMVRNLLPLPIDQRYGLKEMQRVVSEILDVKS